ncbi:MAG: Mfa1 family fimbria major subunit [Prevotella sp.]|nr:Mfa1 family fimbria major subunit [Prevotella sp.]
MKIFKFFPLACAALMMSACSSDNDIEGGATKPGSDPQYLAVNIVNVGTTPTRAGEYENGTEEESKIKKVRFYFFNGDGSPYLIKPTGSEVTGGENVNWLEVSNPTDDTTTPGTSTSVEKITNAVLVINGVQNAAPSAIMAVVNPETVEPATLKNGATMRLSELRSTAVGSKFYNKDASSGKVSDFVMSNSVYINAGEDVCSSLVAGHLTTSEKTAMENPVDLYVERVVAKVTADVDKDAFKVGDGSNWETTKYGTTTAVGKYGDYDVYAVIEGWGLAEENGKAEVEKQVDKSWTDGTLGIGTWNTYDYHRSFWERSVAFNTGVDGNQPVNHKYEEFKAKMKDELYTLPNTPIEKVTNLNTNNLTKLLVAATLRYKDAENYWHNAEICRYNGMNFLGIDNLKNHVASTFSQYYTSTDNTQYTQLSGSDIDFKDPDATMVQYRVTPTLAADPEGVTKKYYTKNPGTTSDFTEVNKSTVLAAIEASKAEVRKDGKAYYFVPIKHLGKAGELGEYGVVRNHFYKITLTGIKGFGTPVYNPELVIDPTVPTYDNTYLAARVQVLQWRVVNQNVSLGE